MLTFAFALTVMPDAVPFTTMVTSAFAYATTIPAIFAASSTTTRAFAASTLSVLPFAFSVHVSALIALIVTDLKFALFTTSAFGALTVRSTLLYWPAGMLKDAVLVVLIVMLVTDLLPSAASSSACVDTCAEVEASGVDGRSGATGTSGVSGDGFAAITFTLHRSVFVLFFSRFAVFTDTFTTALPSLLPFNST